MRSGTEIYGDTVNVANRIEAAGKKLGRPVLISAAVRTRLKTPTPAEAMGAVPLDGQPEPVELYALV